MAMTQTCETCQHWEQPSDLVHMAWGDRWARWGTCNAIPHVDDATNDSRAVASDFEGYSATLRTRDDFGCVMWMERRTVAHTEDATNGMSGGQRDG